MPKPTDPTKHAYMFSDDMKFIQKIILYHPTDPTRFLALKREPNSPTRPNDWDLPGGNVLYGDDPEHSLRHEIIEETGLNVAGDVAPRMVNSATVNGVYILFIGYTGTADGTEAIISHEHTEYQWVTNNEFLHICEAEYLQKFVKQV